MRSLKLQLPEQQSTKQAGACKSWVPKQELGNQPSSNSRRYTQMLEARHSGRDCRNPVHRDVKLWAGNYQNQTLAQRRVALHGFWMYSGHPCPRTLRAAKPCKSAVLPICPAIPAGMTDSILPPTLRHPGYSFVYSVFIFNISLNSGYALVPSFKPHVLRYPIRYQVIIRG